MTATIELIPLKAAIASDRDTTLDVLIRITPPAPPTSETKRSSLNLGFVIDRSGSMNERKKLDYAKEAVCYAIAQLLPSDRMSVTVFDNHVDTLIPSTPANNRASFTRLVQQIQPGGSTALHAGWVQGGIQVSQHLTADLNRVILLSDGLANSGVTSPDAIASDVHGLAQRGVSTSTIGLGNDYNEDLLEAMARSGDGNYYYIADAQQLTDVFEQELQGLAITFGTMVTLGLEPLESVVVADVFNDLDVDAQGRFKLSNLLFDSPLEVVVRFQMPPQTHVTDLCRIHLAWLDSAQQRQTAQVTWQLPVVPSAEWEALPVDPTVQQQVALMQVARAKREAIRLSDRGDLIGASRVLQSAKCGMVSLNLAMSAPEAAALEDLDQMLQKRELAGYRKKAQAQAVGRAYKRSRGHTGLFFAFDGGPELGDICQQKTDAIVNSIAPDFSDSGAISLAIHRAAGPAMSQACQQMPRCNVGEAVITPGFNLSAKWVIHTVCPQWKGGQYGEEALLAQCYRSCLELASQHGLPTIAFPALGIGGLGFPRDRAARIAVTTIAHFLRNHTTIGQVKLVCYDKTTLTHYNAEFQRLES